MRELYDGSHKCDLNPFTRFLYETSLHGCDDETGSVDELGYWFGRLGRYVLVEDDQGFVFHARYVDHRREAGAEAFNRWVEEWVGPDRWAEYMNGDGS